jgi:hypothetical protein
MTRSCWKISTIAAVTVMTGLGAVAAGLSAQQRELDRGVLLITRGGETIGREEFVLVRGSSGTPGLSGFTVTSTVVYPADRPETSVGATVEFGADSVPTMSRYEIGNGEVVRVVMGLGARRITVRTLTRGGESAREYPARERHLVMDDSVFATHAVAPGAAARATRSVTLSGVRGAAVLRIVDHGMEPTTVGPAQLVLHHLTVNSPTGARDLWYDAEGRLMKLVIPTRNLTVIRVQTDQ